MRMKEYTTLMDVFFLFLLIRNGDLRNSFIISISLKIKKHKNNYNKKKIFQILLIYLVFRNDNCIDLNIHSIVLTHDKEIHCQFKCVLQH
jgi:hypothetical protein